MKINKLIITTEKGIFTQVIERFKLSKVEWESGDFEVYTGWNIITDDSENIVLLFCDIKNIELWITDVLENYHIEKVLILWYGSAIMDFELNQWDVILPNTFIDSVKSEKSIFLEYAVWESYDLYQFGLVLNGLCMSEKNEKNTKEVLEEEGIDIVDTESYEILSILEKKDFLDKSVVLKGISWEDEVKPEKNIVQVLELVI